MFKFLDQALHKAYLESKRTLSDGGGFIGPILSVVSSIVGGAFNPEPPSAPAPVSVPLPPTIDSAQVVAAQAAEEKRRAAATGLNQTRTTGGLGAPAPSQITKPTLLGGG